ncbi:hypothetical protein BDR26DRAFT_915078 [Obelidium mucronatum]|nr:hypothetical protein BDR26DRAFT_915078 [Obelidium mucronatum]
MTTNYEASSAPTSTPPSPKTPRSTPFHDLRKRLSGQFQHHQKTVATRVEDETNFFFPPQVSEDPSADIDALTVIGGREAGIPQHIERWLIAKEKAADVHVAEGNYDVDNMIEIGDQIIRRRKKGFDVADMMGVGTLHGEQDETTGSLYNTQDQNGASRARILGGASPSGHGLATPLKRTSSFPPPGFLSKDLSPTSRHNRSKMTIHMVPLHGDGNGGDGTDEDESAGYLLLAMGSTKDIDQLMDSEPAAEAVIRGLDTDKQRERVKDVLQDVQEHITNAAHVKRMSIHPKVDVDQLIMNGEEHELADLDGAKSPKSPKTLISRANSIFRSTKSLHKLSQQNLTKPKMASATTEDVDEMNAVYYPWTVEGDAAKDLTTLLEFADKLQRDRQLLHEPVPIHQVSRHDIDTVVLVGSQENLAPLPEVSKSMLAPPFNTPNQEVQAKLGGSSSGIKKQVPTTTEAAAAAAAAASKSAASIAGIHKSAPQIHKTVDFILPEKSGGALLSLSEASIPTSITSTNNNPKQKRDIDFFFNMADEKIAAIKKASDVDDTQHKKRDFTELVNMADSVLELNEKQVLKGGGGRSKSITVMGPSMNRLSVRLSTARPTVGSGRESSSIREITNRSVMRAFSDNNVYVLDREKIAFEPSKNAAYVKEVDVHAIDVDGMFGIANIAA